MKWITRERVKVDRVACPWLIRKFIDPGAQFLFAPAERVMEAAERENAIPYDVKDVELGHHGKECSFDALVKKYDLGRDPAMTLLAKIVNGADTDNSLWHQPESAGLNAIAEGFRHLGFKDDHEINAAEWIVYEALYAYCQEMVRRGKVEGAFRQAAHRAAGDSPAVQLHHGPQAHRRCAPLGIDRLETGQCADRSTPETSYEHENARR